MFSLKNWLKGRAQTPVRKPNRVRLGVESLEGRDVPTTWTWMGAGVEDSNDMECWSGDTTEEMFADGDSFIIPANTGSVDLPLWAISNLTIAEGWTGECGLPSYVGGSITCGSGVNFLVGDTELCGTNIFKNSVFGLKNIPLPPPAGPRHGTVKFTQNQSLEEPLVFNNVDVYVGYGTTVFLRGTNLVMNDSMSIAPHLYNEGLIGSAAPVGNNGHVNNITSNSTIFLENQGAFAAGPGETINLKGWVMNGQFGTVNAWGTMAINGEGENPYTHDSVGLYSYQGMMSVKGKGTLTVPWGVYLDQTTVQFLQNPDFVNENDNTGNIRTIDTPWMDVYSSTIILGDIESHGLSTTINTGWVALTDCTVQTTVNWVNDRADRWVATDFDVSGGIFAVGVQGSFQGLVQKHWAVFVATGGNVSGEFAELYMDSSFTAGIAGGGTRFDIDGPIPA